jgi:hypothetical protein
MAKIDHLEEVQEFKNISLSSKTEAKCIYDIVNDLRHQPRSSSKIIQAYSIAVDEKTFFFNICTLHLDTIKVYYSRTNAQVIVLKTILKFTLK